MSIDFKTSDFKNPIDFLKNSAKKVSEINKTIMAGKMLSSPEARKELIQEGVKLAIKHYATKGMNWLKDGKDMFMKYMKK